MHSSMENSHVKLNQFQTKLGSAWRALKLLTLNLIVVWMFFVCLGIFLLLVGGWGRYPDFSLQLWIFDLCFYCRLCFFQLQFVCVPLCGQWTKVTFTFALEDRMSTTGHKRPHITACSSLIPGLWEIYAYYLDHIPVVMPKMSVWNVHSRMFGCSAKKCQSKYYTSANEHFQISYVMCDGIYLLLSHSPLNVLISVISTYKQILRYIP